MKKSSILLMLFILSTFTSLGQIKKIRFKNEYEHSKTKTVFPKVQFGYNLEEVTAFDKKKENVCVEYKSSDSDNTKISIYIYPAFSGYEGRLRNEFLNSLTAINYNSKNKIDFKVDYSKIEDEKFSVNGLKTSFIDDQSNNSKLAIYECGTWFLKIRITSDKLSSEQINTLEEQIAATYSPPKFTALKPLNLKGKVTVTNQAFRDSLFLASSLAESFKKLAWAINNVSEKEKKSGFPDLYLKMHIESIKQFIEIGDLGKNVKMKRTEFTGKFIADVKSLISSGFLEEYIMEAYQKVMIVPDDIILDYDGYDKWKENNTIPEFLFPESIQVSYEDN